MIYSMTGFAFGEREVKGGTLVLELRTVNHRYLELHLRLDDALRRCEPALRAAITARIRRGKVECRAALVAMAGGHLAATIDPLALAQLARLVGEVRLHFPDSAPLSLADALRWPGVLINETTDAGELQAELLALLELTLEELAAARAREGDKLKTLILERVTAMEAQLARVRPLLPELLRTHQVKLRARLFDALGAVNEERLSQELALYLQKIDIEEELDRLAAHLEEVKHVLASGEAVGKRLDFLMQELNREANTLGSKSVSSLVSQISMALKVLIEQMREQVQNLE